MLSKDEKSYLKILQARRDKLSKEINLLQQQKQNVVDEIYKLASGKHEFKQTEIEWKEL